MAIWKSSFAWLQKIGKAMMLPVSVLPVAGILLGIGSSHLGWLPHGVSDLLAQAGGAIFGSLPLIFAIAVALGLTQNDGVSALAATVGFVVQLATMGVVADLLGHETKMIFGIKSIETGVFGGIAIGGVTAALFNRYYKIQLPTYLGFFAGKRFVPIITAFAAIGMGTVLSLIWPPIGGGIHQISRVAAYGNPVLAAGLHSFVERLLIPFGLHHIWNVPFFFEMGEFKNSVGQVVHGDIQRFFAGDPTAGILGGGYLVKMFGLPAAALAIWQCAKPNQKAKVGSLMVSAALTSFLTGITEPIEFSFLFIAPALYFLHALLAGASQVIFGLLGVKLGFTFSHGLIDYLLYFSLDTKPFFVLLLGPLYALAYYGVFRASILKFDLKTPGRDIEEGDLVSQVASPQGRNVARPPVLASQAGVGMTAASRPAELVRALGGKLNIVSLDACITRLRVELSDLTQLNVERLKQLGASGVIKVGNGVQAIFGPLSENLKQEIQEYLSQQPLDAEEDVQRELQMLPSQGLQDTQGAKIGAPSLNLEKVWEGLGGRSNLLESEGCAQTRVRLVLRDSTLLDEALLKKQGVLGVMKFEPRGAENRGNLIHLIVGPGAAEVAKQLGR